MYLVAEDDLPLSIRCDRSHGVTCTETSSGQVDGVGESALDDLLGEGVLTTKPAPRVDLFSGGDLSAARRGRLEFT